MKKIILAFSIIVIVAATGCMTSKISTITPAATNTVTGVVFPAVTNTVTSVNTNNLMLDASVLQGLTAIAVSEAVQRDPSCVQPLKDAQTALDGILNGANTNTTTQVVALLGSGSNPVLVSEISPLIGTLSSLEQTLLNKYGSGVSGQISIALTRAVLAGITVGLAGK